MLSWLEKGRTICQILKKARRQGRRPPQLDLTRRCTTGGIRRAPRTWHPYSPHQPRSSQATSGSPFSSSAQSSLFFFIPKHDNDLQTMRTKTTKTKTKATSNPNHNDKTTPRPPPWASLKMAGPPTSSPAYPRCGHSSLSTATSWRRGG